MRSRAWCVALLALLCVTAWAATSYQYEGVTELPAMSSIKVSVDNAAFGAQLQGVRWDEDTTCLCIMFEGTLDASEKSTLDTIVTTNSNWTP